MNIEQRRISVNGLRVEIVRKDIKNLHLGVYPPGGRIRVAVPLRVSDDAVRLAVIGKLAWIHRQRARFEAQPRQSAREMVSGERHYFLGQRYRLRVVPHNGAGQVLVRSTSTIEIHVWAVKRMKTRWGTCNAEAGRIWLNLELAKKPVQCLEYLVVHELAHFIERQHNDCLVGLVDQHLPLWRLHRAELNAAPLAHETWKY